MQPGATCLVRASVDAHFSGRNTPEQEAAMRAHLPECESCRTLYERHLLYGELTRRGLAPVDRLGRGLGFDPPAARPFWAIPGYLSVTGLAAAACLALVLGGTHLVRRSQGQVQDQPQGSGEAHGQTDDFTARGGAAPSTQPELEIFRIDRSGRAQPVAGWIANGDELGFAYRNPGGARYLMVYAVDHVGRIYWLHPYWAEGGPTPQSVPIQRSAERQELSKVVRHAFTNPSLQVIALFTERPLSVHEVEARLRSGRPASPGAVELEFPLHVRAQEQP